MTQVKVNARDIIFEVNDGDDEWLRVENLASVTRNPGENEETADTTDFDSQGAYEQDVMQRGSSLELEGLEMRDNATGAPQPGRARMEALGGEEAVGYDSRGQVRFRHPLVQTWSVWDCTVTLGETGGGTNDKSAWSATVTKCGLTSSVAVA